MSNTTTYWHKDLPCQVTYHPDMCTYTWAVTLNGVLFSSDNVFPSGLRAIEDCAAFIDRKLEEGNQILAEEEIDQLAGTADSRQVGGDHYKSLAVQPWDAMKAWLTPEEFQGFLKGNALKYLARKKESEIEDVKKAVHYLEKWLEEKK